MMTPRPNTKHQQIQSALIIEFGGYLKNKTCGVLGETEIQLGQDVFGE